MKTRRPDEQYWPSLTLSAATLAVLLWASFVGVSAPIPGRATPACHIPRLTDLETMELVLEEVRVNGQPVADLGGWSDWQTASLRPARWGDHIHVQSWFRQTDAVDPPITATPVMALQFVVPSAEVTP